MIQDGVSASKGRLLASPSRRPGRGRRPTAASPSRGWRGSQLAALEERHKHLDWPRFHNVHQGSARGFLG